jgi:phospholipase C
MSLKSLALMFAAAVMLAGCGSDASTPSAASSSTSSGQAVVAASPTFPTPVPVPPATPTGTIVVDTSQIGKVPLAYTEIRFSGYDQAAARVYGPVSRGRAATITLSEVPVAVVHLRLQFYDDGTLVGTSGRDVVIEAGGTVIIDVAAAVPKVPGLIVESNEGVEPILDFIGGAAQSVDVAVSALSQSQVVGELLSATRRGVRVRVLFGASPSPSIADALRAAGIATAVKAGSGEETIVVDRREALVMTLDLSDAPFGVQRDYAVLRGDSGEVGEIASMFDADFSGNPFTPSQPALVWSPQDARARLLGLIEGAASSLDIETAELTDSAMVTALLHAAEQGVKVRLVMSGNSRDASAANREALATAGAEVAVVNSPTLDIHADMLVADGARAFVGSQSLSSAALDAERELGVLVDDASQVVSLETAFGNDFEMAKRVGPVDPHTSGIKHIVVIFNENQSFDHLYGTFPGVNGVLDDPVLQVDESGVPYATLPPLSGSQYPMNAPNAPFLVDPYYSLSESLPSPVHRFYQNLLQLNGTGYAPNFYAEFQRNKFVAVEGDLGPMGYWDTTTLPMYPIARQATVCDNYFTGTFGGSMFNAIFLVTAQPVTWPDAPASQVLEPQFSGYDLVGLKNANGAVTPDGYLIEDTDPMYLADPNQPPSGNAPPPSTLRNVGDGLTDANVSWAWYAEGWNQAVAGHPPSGFVQYHLPYLYFQNYLPGKPGRAHMQDLTDFQTALAAGTLPGVCWIKALDTNDEHPGSSTQLAGEQFAAGIIQAVQASSSWKDTVIILTYDDFGGFYDHVAPVMQDRWGPGQRVPCVIVSPFAKAGYVDSTLYDQASILKFIEWRHGLRPLTERDRNAANFVPNAFNF